MSPLKQALTGRGYATRLAVPEDGDGVTALLRASYPRLMREAYAPEVLAPALPLITRANPVLLGSGRYFVAESDAGEVVGCGGWTPERPGTGEVVPGVGHVRHFATHPDWTRRGVGGAVFQAALGQARQQGIGVLECYASLNAEQFYASLGFVRLAVAEVYHGSQRLLPSVHMRLAVTALPA